MRTNKSSDSNSSSSSRLATVFYAFGRGIKATVKAGVIYIVPVWVNVIATFASVAEFFGKMFGQGDKKSLYALLDAGMDTEPAKALGRDALIVSVGSAAVAGIYFFNIAAMKNFWDQIALIVSNDKSTAEKIATLRKLIRKIGLAIPAGAALAALSTMMLPFLVGGKDTSESSSEDLEKKLSLLIEVTKYLTWLVVGLGVGGAVEEHIVQPIIKFFTEQTFPEQRCVQEITEKMQDRVTFSMHGEKINEANDQFLQALGFESQQQVTIEEIKERLTNKLRGSSEERQAVYKALAVLTNHPYPQTKKILSEIFPFIVALPLAAIGTYGLKGLIEIGFAGWNPQIVTALAWGGWLVNTAMWTKFSSYFFKEALNPSRHFIDTWRNASHKERAVRVAAAGLGISFGTMMALPALMGTTVGPFEIAGASAGFGDNALVSGDGLNAVWKYAYGWIKQSSDERLQSNIEYFFKAVLKLTAAEQTVFFSELYECLTKTCSVVQGSGNVQKTASETSTGERAPLLLVNAAPKCALSSQPNGADILEALKKLSIFARSDLEQGARLSIEAVASTSSTSTGVLSPATTTI